MSDKWDIRGVINSLEGDLDDLLELGADIVVAEISTKTPVDSGNLKGNTTKKKVGKLHHRVFNNTEYAADVEFGTAPHTIIPVKKKALRWRDKSGKVHFAKRVNHPGTTAQPFMRPGFRAAKPKIDRLLRGHGA